MLSLKMFTILAGILVVKGTNHETATINALNATNGTVVLSTIATTRATMTTRSPVIPCNSSALLFHCHDNRTCISRYSFCNNVTQCPDGSDEIVYNASTSSRGMRCQFNHPIRTSIIRKWCDLPDRYKCDEELDCVGGFDECGCRHTFQCQNRNCLMKIQFCDGWLECSDGTDERLFNRSNGIGFQCPVTKRKQTRNCILPDQYVCDGDSDCEYDIDECFCDNSTGSKKYMNTSFSNNVCFRCLDRSLIIPNNKVCDGTIHCQDLSDECLCFLKRGYTVPAVCNYVCNGRGCDCPGRVRCLSNVNQSQWICLEPTSICDRRMDCLNGTDEHHCPRNGQFFICSDKLRKVPKFQLCDGARDCLDGSDEWNCSRLFDYYCNSYRFLFSLITDWDNRTQTDLVRIPSRLGRLPSLAPLYAKRCDGVVDCMSLDDECYATGDNCSSRPGNCNLTSSVVSGFRCNNSASSISGKEVCDGFPTCHDKKPHESIDELFCHQRFYCNDRGRSRLPIHIPLSARCDWFLDCADQSDEIGCNEKTHFYCNDSSSIPFIRRSQVCDGAIDCSSGADECDQCTTSPFSSDDKLISNNGLAGFVWFVGLFSVIGNLAAIVYNLKSLTRRDQGHSQIAFFNRILVLNLSISDLLVGIYLISIGVKNVSEKRYCLYRDEWRSGAVCAGLGTIALLGSEASVFILLIMTGYRLYIVKKPFQGTQSHRFIILAILVAWGLALFFVLVPHSPSLRDYFVTCIWYRHTPFFDMICQKNLEKLINEWGAIRGHGRFALFQSGSHSWSNMIDAIAELNQSYSPERFFGYYSAHSVCLPRLFPDPSEDFSWGYSLFLMLLNFIAFIFIFSAYVHIYRLTKKSQAACNVPANSSDKRSAKLQRKIARIVLTDFCCWIPICIMAFIKLSGVHLSDIAYAFTAIVLLPINSAMNPLLYSDILDYAWDKMLSIRQSCRPYFERRSISQSSGEERGAWQRGSPEENNAASTTVDTKL